MPSIDSVPLSPAQIAARVRAADGIGSGIEADLSMARRSARRGGLPAHDPYSAGIATAQINHGAVRAIAILGG